MIRTATTLVLLALALAAAPAAAGIDDYPGQTEDEAERAAARAWGMVDDLRRSTGRYHDLSAAIEDGFTPLSVDGGSTAACVHGTAGGKGISYARGIDASLEPMQPEAMLYEVTPDGQHRLVAVEYVVPAEFVEDAEGNVVDLPEVHGRPLQRLALLPLYVLPVWIWQDNPAGMFADLNPDVGPCPVV
jgi:hypothetical protein